MPKVYQGRLVNKRTCPAFFPQMSVARRRRLQRFERELDTWFAELAAMEGTP